MVQSPVDSFGVNSIFKGGGSLVCRMHSRLVDCWEIYVSGNFDLEPNWKNSLNYGKAKPKSKTLLTKDIDSIESPLAANIISGMTIPKKKDLIMMIPTAHPDALDLMRKLLMFNPN